MRARIAAGWILVVLLLAAPAALAAPREARIPLRDGALRLSDLSQALCRELHLPACNLGLGSVDFKRLRNSDCVAALNESLGDGCRVSVADDALVLHVDYEKLPRDCRAMSKAMRVFAAVAAPEATAAQRALYGLRLPERYDPERPLVVLVHGLDCSWQTWTDMTDRLAAAGHQYAYFTYPSDQPIGESAAFLGSQLTKLRQSHPQARVNLLAHSMGGLVSRAYVEGPGYGGEVDRLIMIAPPNGGSKWSRVRFLLEAQEHYQLWKHEKGWSPSWMLTDGAGEAGRDLKPGSSFLRELNARPRRAGVRYTIIAGSQSPTRRVTANCLSRTANCINGRAAGWWGFRQCKSGLSGAADRMRNKVTDGDGPVEVKSTRLAGVDDFVLVHADHATLCFATGRTPPGAWETVRDRLAR
jgi:pimeloyl-ACP methyl ester carboxylesterase